MKKLNLFMLIFIMVAAILAAPMVATATKAPVFGQTLAPANPLYPPGIGWNPYVNYSKPQWSQSPGIRKFVDGLPGLGLPGCVLGNLLDPNSCHENNLGQYIPIAGPDLTSYPGADYYEIGAVKYQKQMNSDLPAAGTRLLGYYQKNVNGAAVSGPVQYLGPVIIAHRDRPVRVKFFNELPDENAGGKLFLPVDESIMGSGMGPNGTLNFNDNRLRIPHLHGGLNPWISDGTPHQWLTPFHDSAAALGGAVYQKGASFVNVPDMVNGSVVNGVPVPCVGLNGKCFTAAANDGIGTLYWTNQQSQRLMFYHDHAWGTTRLTVYAGVAAGYVLTDQVEEDLLAGTNVSGVFTVNPTTPTPTTKILPDLGGVYHYGIPLVIQDKGFVNDATTPPGPGFPAAVTGYKTNALTAVNDPLWYTYVNDQIAPATTTGGDLWFPHEYLPVENPFDPSGNTPWGRWDYGPFMNPAGIPTNLTMPSPSTTPEAFMDTAVVNGTAFPYIDLPPDAVRFRILSVGNDRVLNLHLYKADPLRVNVTNGGTGYTTAPTVAITGGCPAANACSATLTPVMGTGPNAGMVTGITVTNVTGSYTHPDATGYIPPVITITGTGTLAAADAVINKEVKMVDAAPNAAFPSWPRDGRDGGVPDPLTMGPSWIHIGNEGGWLAQATVLPPQPVDYEYNRQVIPFASVNNNSLLLLPAMRADVVVDFSSYVEGDTLILYNDAPAAMSFFWPNNDYYTDCPDLTAVGAQVSTPAGFGPNTRTVMQIRIKGTKTSTFDFGKDGTGPSTVALQAMLPKAFKKDSDPILVPQIAYNGAYPVGDPLHYNGAVDNYMQNVQTTYNIGGAPKTIQKIKTAAPGNSYNLPPDVVIVPSGGTGGTGATAVAGLNPCGGVTLLTSGTGYTSAPTVTLGAPAPVVGTALAVQATALATVSGGQVTAIAIDEPGANYTNILLAPTCTITGGGGTGATCSAMLPTLNTVGSIVLTNPGSGYTAEPLVYLLPAPGDNGLGAMADALLNGVTVMTGKMINEGFDVEFGRMDIRLGSVPNPLTPNVGNGFVVGIARYIDPPTEIMNDGELVLWRLGHIGVDSHALHFHLFNVQVVNRVDWTNVVKPPYEDEIGWRETIRTNPMEDILVAIKPYAPVLPFQVPNSNRLLDPSTPLNSTINFLPVAPPLGIPAVAQLGNVVTNFNWEYVWHCHMLGHEENDFMRPISFVVVPPAAPSTLTALRSPNGQAISVVLSWNDNSVNETNFKINRSTSSTFSTATTVNIAVPAKTGTTATTGTKATYTDNDPALLPSTTYYYRVRATNSAGLSATTNVVTVTTGTGAPPTAPPVLTTGAITTTSVAFSWPALSAATVHQTGFVFQQATAPFPAIMPPNPAGFVTSTINTPTLTTHTFTGLTHLTPYYFRVGTTNAAGTTWSTPSTGVQVTP